jgi:F-type H+-transporting ATPase subunit delta
MNESKITVRYAKALFALSKEGNALEPMRNDMELLFQCIKEIPELQYIIESPVIKVTEKVKLFEESFKSSFSPLTLSFVKLVLERRREEYLLGISRYFLSLLKADRGISPAELVTAVPLNDKLRQAILHFITKRFCTEVELQEVVDKDLIGGFILRIGDQQLDASISSKLARIKTALMNKKF